MGPATCYQDYVARILPHTVTIESDKNSLEWCAYQCFAAGGNYTIAGVEFGVACFCGTALPTSPKLDPSKCSMPCAANATEKCGDSYVEHMQPKLNICCLCGIFNSLPSLSLSSIRFALFILFTHAFTSLSLLHCFHSLALCSHLYLHTSLHVHFTCTLLARSPH